MDELLAALDAELGEDAINVSLHRPHRDNQPIGDLTVGQSSRGQHDDLAFTVGDRQRLGQGMDCGCSYSVLAGQPLRAGRRLQFLAAAAGAPVFARRLGCRVGGQR